MLIAAFLVVGSLARQTTNPQARWTKASRAEELHGDAISSSQYHNHPIRAYLKGKDPRMFPKIDTWAANNRKSEDLDEDEN